MLHGAPADVTRFSRLTKGFAGVIHMHETTVYRV